MNGTGGDRVLIVGGGVAGLETLLALRALVPGRASAVVLSPGREYVHRPLAIAEPFGHGVTDRWDLAELVGAAGGAYSQGALSAVEPDRRRVITDSGNEFPYDHLVLALGTTPRAALEGAITYGGPPDNHRISELLDRISAEDVRRIAFAVPTAVRWALPLYELALLTATFAEERRLDVELALITHEPRPLAAFGKRASASIEELLAQRGIELRCSAAPAAAGLDELVLMNGTRVAADVVVALPALEVGPLEGVPQGPHGFIGTDALMRVEGMTDAYAVGDATWFPIKQGGLATQQADTAATAIASTLDPEIEPVPFRPVLRGALLTGAAPQYMRGEISRPEVSAVGTAPLWWPPSKVAGRHLGPFLAELAAPGSGAPGVLEDRGDPGGEDRARLEDDQAEVIELALAAADSDAGAGDFQAALRWLEVAESLGLTLSPAYGRRRDEWERRDVELRGRPARRPPLTRRPAAG